MDTAERTRRGIADDGHPGTYLLGNNEDDFTHDEMASIHVLLVSACSPLAERFANIRGSFGPSKDSEPVYEPCCRCNYIGMTTPIATASGHCLCRCHREA